MTARFLTPLLAVGVLFTGVGVAERIDLDNVPYSGYETAPNNTITVVRPGSPAQAAGLTIGDRLIRVNGVDIEDARAQSRMPRAAIGETRTIVVESAGTATTRDVAIAYAALPTRDKALRWAGFFIGLCYVAAGLLAYARVPGRASLLFAITGLALSLLFFSAPYVSSYRLRIIIDVSRSVVSLLGFALLLHLFLVYPTPNRILARRGVAALVYAPAALVSGFIAWLIVFQPRETTSLNALANTTVGLTIAAYFGLSVFALALGVVTTPRSTRKEQGLGVLLAGVAAALGPVTVSVLVGVVAPTVVLPGSDFYVLTLACLPIAIAAAMMRHAPVTRVVPAGFHSGAR